MKRAMRVCSVRIIAALLLSASLLGVFIVNPPRVVRAAAFTPSNLVVLRAGDGSVALSSAAAPVFLDEYSKAGALVQSIPMPTADSGSNQILTIAGSSTADGALNRSNDGRFLTLAGYDAAPGTLAVAGTSSAANNRIVGMVDANGTIDTTTRISDSYSAANFRSSVTNDGTGFWITGSNSGVHFVTLGSAGTTTTVSTTLTNMRVASIYPGYNGFPTPQLYISAASGAFQGVSTVGSGLPTTTGQTTAALPGFPITAGPSSYAYIFYDLNGGVAGVDTLYVADDRAAASGGGIQKWTYDGTTWTLSYTMNGGGSVGARGLTGTTSSGVPVLWATTTETSANRIIRVTDTGAGSTFTTIATAAANTVFRGIAFAPLVNGGPTAANGVINGRITDSNDKAVAGAVVRLSGSQTRKTITDANGFYRFENVEPNGFYTVAPAHAGFSFSPAERSFSQLANNTEATFTASLMAAKNSLDTPEYFVRQHYLDFLGREPDEAGFNFWSDQILECGDDAACAERRTINVSAAYFRSLEFQETGGIIDRLNRASFGVDPKFAEFMIDRDAIARDVVVGKNGWAAQLTTNKQAFVKAWVARAGFKAAFDNLADVRYVDTLLANANASFSQAERDSLVNGLSGGTLSRAAVLQQIAENESFAKARYNEAFVLMEYFGYLRRDPDASGYRYWLDKLNSFAGDFERAEMVKAFIVSGEYRNRFDK
jgi:hypothetical protein